MKFDFQSPEFLWLLFLVPILFMLKGKIGRSAAVVFSNTEIAKNVSSKKKTKAGSFLFLLRILALVSLIIALARPQLGKGESKVSSSGVDIMLAVDISSSMLALDFSTKQKAYTRLDIVKTVLDEFVEKRPNDRIGLIAFAGNPYLVSPLTLNHDWLIQNIERIRIGLIEDGTAIGGAIGSCVNRLKELPSKSKIIILLTDGENNAGSITPLAAAETAAAYQIKVYTIAAGKNGIVHTYLLDNKGDIAKDAYGNPRIFETNSPIDEESLVKISEITGAKSYRASSQEDLKNIYREIDGLEKSEVKLTQFSSFEELFMYPLLFGLCLIGLEQILVNTRFRRIP